MGRRVPLDADTRAPCAHGGTVPGTVRNYCSTTPGLIALYQGGSRNPTNLSLRYAQGSGRCDSDRRSACPGTQGARWACPCSTGAWGLAPCPCDGVATGTCPRTRGEP